MRTAWRGVAVDDAPRRSCLFVSSRSPPLRKNTRALRKRCGRHARYNDRPERPICKSGGPAAVPRAGPHPPDRGSARPSEPEQESRRHEHRVAEDEQNGGGGNRPAIEQHVARRDHHEPEPEQPDVDRSETQPARRALGLLALRLRASGTHAKKLPPGEKRAPLGPLPLPRLGFAHGLQPLPVPALPADRDPGHEQRDHDPEEGGA